MASLEDELTILASGGTDDQVPSNSNDDPSPKTGLVVRSAGPGPMPTDGAIDDSTKPVTTTVSTIAVQSGTTRIVIALLQSKDWLQLKIQEMQPAMTEIGENLEKALILQKQHELALEKLQTKQSPVEELLNQADELISNQKPRAEVYSAMAENLGLAWKDLNAQLDQRRIILDHAVLFHTRTKEFSERMDQAHREFSDTFLPDEAESCRSILQRIHDTKKGLLENSMRTLAEGQSLLERLCEVATHSMGDSRPAHMSHVAQQTSHFVEQYMETLHDRKRHLEALWLQRKTKLEQCLQLCLIYHDLNEVKQWLHTKGAEYIRHTNLGDSAPSAEILQHEHTKFEAETKEVQDRSIRLLCTAEQLSAGGHYAGEEIQTKAYETLEECSELFTALDNRRQLLAKAVAFFKAAQTALNKLEQIEVQLLTTESMRSNAQMSQAIEDIALPPLQEGYELLDSVGKQNPGAQGVVRKVEELENFRLKLSTQFSELSAVNQERNAAYEKFFNQYKTLKTWLDNVGQAFLQGHQDMGSVLPMAKDFLERHERLLNDLRMKGMEVEALLSTVPALIRNGGEDAEEVHQKSEELRLGWEHLRLSLETRILLAQRFLAFHKLTVQLGKEMDSIEETAKNREGHISETLVKQFEEKWVTIQQLILQFNNTGKNVISDAQKVEDPYLDTQRAIICVENLMEQMKNRKDALNTLWASWQIQVAEGKEQRIQWEHFFKEANKVITDVKHFEDKLYPIIPADVYHSDAILDYLEKIRNSIPDEISHALTELEVKRKTMELFNTNEIQFQKDQLMSDLNTKQQNFQLKITEYHVLISMMITFFTNFKELENMLHKQQTQYKMVILTSELDRSEALLRDHEANRQAALEVIKYTGHEADQVITKIESVEPPMSAVRDKDKISTLIETRKRNFDSIWEEHKQRLEQNLQFCHFNKDLQQINHQLEQLENHLISMKGNYGESLPTAIVTSEAFVQFEKTLELLEIRIRQFVSTAEKMIQDQHVESRSIHIELENLRTKWSTFHMQVGDNRRCVNLAIDYFKLVEEAEMWFREGSQVLMVIARKSTNCKSPQEATDLLNEVDKFLKPGERKQQERIDKISTLAIQLYGDSGHTSTKQVSGKSREMFDSFAAINNELSTLAQNLKDTENEQEIERKRMQDKVQQLKARQSEAAAALKAAQSEATAAKAAAAAAQEEARAIRAAAEQEVRMTVEEHYQQKTVITKQEAVPIPRKLEPLPAQVTPPPTRIQMPMHPVFVVPLSNADVMEGSKVIFECRVEGFPTPYIQWLKDGILIQNNPDYQTTFVDEICTLTIEETFTEDSAKFTCKATNAAGIAETHGALIVKESRPHEELIPPQFITELTPGGVQEGQSHQFSCEVTGHPLPSVSWYKNDICLDNSPDYVITENNGMCTLLIKEAYLEDDAKFICRAANPAGHASCSAKLAVLPLAPIEAPIVLSPLSNVMARAGQKLRLECRVKGQPNPQITWMRDNKVIRENRDIKLQYDGDRAVLVITEAFPKDAGTYVVNAKNDAGDATSSCTVLVKGRLPLETSDSELASDMEPIKPQVMKQLVNQMVAEGSRTRMDCIIVGQPEPEVIWYHNGKPVKESDDFQLLFEGDCCTLVIKEAYLEDAGSYKCVAINSGGEASSQCTLTVEPLSEFSDVERSQRDVIVSVETFIAPSFEKMLKDLAIIEGHEIALECKVNGDPEPSLTWHKNDQDVELSSYYNINRLDGGVSTLSIPEAKLEDGGFYSVKASNKGGQAKCFCTVTVSPKPIVPKAPTKSVAEVPPIFTKYLEDIHLQAGNEAKFECSVAGTPKPEVKWAFRGWPIQADPAHKIESSGDVHTMVMPNVQSTSAGRYSVTAENMSGQATSAASLTVEEPSLVPLPDASEQRVHSMVMSKRSTVMQQSHLSSLTQQYESNASSFQRQEMTSVQQQGFTQIGSQSSTSFSQQKTEVRQVSSSNLSHGIPDFKPLSLPAVLSAEREKSSAVSEAHTIPMSSAPRFTTPVTSTLVTEGDKVSLEGRIEGHPEPVVKWFKNNIELFNKPEINIGFENGRASLSIQKSSEKDTARYSCTASNSAGSATSSADVVVKPHRVPPKFLQRLSPAVVKSGERLLLEVKVDGHPAPDVTWYRNDILLVNSPDFRLNTDGQMHSLLIPEVFPDDSGKLMVKAINAAGEAQSIANLIVEEDQEQNGYREYSIVEQKHEVSFPYICQWDLK